MAILPVNDLLSNLRGQLGKQLVFKRYGDKTVVTSFPNMSKVKASRKQKANRSGFAKAVAYAKSIVNNPALKKKYLKKVKACESVYHYALKEWFRKEK